MESNITEQPANTKQARGDTDRAEAQEQAGTGIKTTGAAKTENEQARAAQDDAEQKAA